MHDHLVFRLPCAFDDFCIIEYTTTRFGVQNEWKFDDWNVSSTVTPTVQTPYFLIIIDNYGSCLFVLIAMLRLLWNFKPKPQRVDPYCLRRYFMWRSVGYCTRGNRRYFLGNQRYFGRTRLSNWKIECKIYQYFIFLININEWIVYYSLGNKPMPIEWQHHIIFL